jgi:hypothetical protein
MPRIYIAGPMTGLPDFNRQAFYSAEAKLLEAGHIVLSPAVLPTGLTQLQYMDICFAMLRAADAIYMLSGWEHSPGARAENALAEKLELDIQFQTNGEAPQGA